MKKIAILIGFLAVSFYCNKEISVIEAKDVQKGDKKAWEAYYDAIPKLKTITNSKSHILRVKRIYDPRLEDFSDERYEELYRQIEKDVTYYLYYDIKIEEVGKEDILHFFRRHNKQFQRPEFRYLIGGHILHPESPADEDRLRKTIANALKDKPWEIIKKYVSDPGIRTKNIDQLTSFFLKQFREKFSEIGQISTKNPEQNLRFGEYALTQQYSYWSSILYETDEADLFITNSIMDSADDTMPLYVINRGGITSGVTENNIKNSYQGAVLLTLMPFISNDRYFIRERGNILDNILLPIISMMGVHELGHLLRRFDENYGFPVTPQNAPVDLRYQDWYYNIINGKNMATGLKYLDKY